MQAYIDPRIQKDAELLKESIASLTFKIEESRRILTNLENSLKEQELKLATILPYTLPVQNTQIFSHNSTHANNASEEHERKALRDGVLNLLRIKGAMRSSQISQNLGDGTKKRNNKIHNMLKTLMNQNLIKSSNQLPTGEMITRDLIYNII